MTWNTSQHAIETFDRCWILQASAPGVLKVRSSESALRYDDFRYLVEHLLAKRVDEAQAEIIFDFSDVRTIEAPWTLAVAQLVDFARRSHAACRVKDLQGQPAAIVSLLLGDGAYRTILQIDEQSAIRLN